MTKNLCVYARCHGTHSLTAFLCGDCEFGGAQFHLTMAHPSWLCSPLLSMRSCEFDLLTQSATHNRLALGPAMWTIFIVVIGILTNLFTGAEYKTAFLVPAVFLSVAGVSSALYWQKSKKILVSTLVGKLCSRSQIGHTHEHTFIKLQRVSAPNDPEATHTII